MYLKIAAISAISASIVTAAMMMLIIPSTRPSVTDNFDWGSIRSAEAAGTNNLLLRVDGMPGSSTVDGFSSRTDIPGCNAHQSTNSFTNTDFDGFHFIMADNKATPKLMTAYLDKTPIKTVTFFAQRGTQFGGASDYLVVTLSNVTLTSYFHASNEEYKIPVVEASLTFDKIHIVYKEGTTDVQAGWDFKANKPF
jgi:type VI secretion system Hcp family effector